jgi:hypothetical protein
VCAALRDDAWLELKRAGDAGSVRCSGLQDLRAGIQTGGHMLKRHDERARQQSADKIRSHIATAMKVLGWNEAQTALMVKRPKGGDEKTDKTKVKQLSAFVNSKEVQISIPRQYLKLALDLRKLLDSKNLTKEADYLKIACSKYCSQINPFEISNYLALPTRHSDKFRFRIPRAEHELIPFQEFSDNENDIAGAHEGLEGEKRRTFYRTWFERCREAFLILDRIDRRGNWEAVAVSIVLPLTEEGRDAFCRGAVVTVNPDNESSGLTPYIVKAGGKSPHLLYDTLIVRHKIDNRGISMSGREAVHKWQTALMFRHLSLLIDSLRAPVEVLVEPDFWQIDLECEIFHFKRISEKLWSVAYPNTATESATQFFDAFWRNIEHARKWNVENDESPRA